MAADSSEQAAAAWAFERFLGDLCGWAIQPQRDGLPSGWAGAYRDRLNELQALIQRQFPRTAAGFREFGAASKAAREFIGILESNPQVAAAPVSEWTVAAFVEVFERVAKYRRVFFELANRQPLQVRAGSDEGGPRNPWRQAAKVLHSNAWLEGTAEPFPMKSAFDPQAVQRWNRCVDAVAALPDEGGPLGIARRLKLRFVGTHSSPASEVNGVVLYRWENCPSGPWVSAAELEALGQGAAAWDLLNSRDDSSEARRIQRLAEWLQAIAAIDPRKPEALQLLQRAAAVLWGFERSADDELSTGAMNAVLELSRTLKPKVRQAAAGLGFNAADQASLFAVDYSTRSNAWEALQAAAENRAAAVDWSKPRSPTQWRQLRSEKELPDGATWWKEQRKADSQAFRGTTKLVSITRAKAIEWGLELEEFKSPN